MSQRGSKLDMGGTLRWSDDRREIKELVTTLVSKHKPFSVCWDDLHGCWEVYIEETNEVGGLAGRWADA